MTTEKILQRAECSKPAYDASFEPGNVSVCEHNYFQTGARFENQRLLPIIKELCAVIEEIYVSGYLTKGEQERLEKLAEG